MPCRQIERTTRCNNAVRIVAAIGAAIAWIPHPILADEPVALCISKESHTHGAEGELESAEVSGFARGLPRKLFRVDLRNGALSSRDLTQEAEPFGPEFATGRLKILAGEPSAGDWLATWLPEDGAAPGLQFLHIKWSGFTSGKFENAPFTAWNGSELFTGICVFW